MKQKIARLGALMLTLAALLLSACADTQSQPLPTPAENTPAAPAPAETPRADIDSPEPADTPEPTSEPATDPTPEPTPELWRGAYRETAERCELEFPPQEGGGERLKYSLIDFDGDDTPELAAVLDGFCVSLYTCADGQVYELMDRWAYGAMGNAGYEYCPGKNSLRNYNSDYAGLIMYTTYMAIGPEHTLDETAQIVTYNFDDANGNGAPDEDEYGSAFNYGVSYYNGSEISDEDAAAFDAGEYEFIEGTMSFDELMAELEG